MKKIVIFGISSWMILSIIIGTTANSASNIYSVYAEANCETTTPALNPAENWKGNVKQCSGISGPEGSKEPIRSCESPNKFKDNDGDGNEICKIRGNN